MSSDLNEGFHAVRRSNMSALGEVTLCERTAVDGAKVPVRKAQSLQRLRIDQIDNK